MYMHRLYDPNRPTGTGIPPINTAPPLSEEILDPTDDLVNVTRVVFPTLF